MIKTALITAAFALLAITGAQAEAVKPVGPPKVPTATITQSASNVKSPPTLTAGAGVFDGKACIASGGTVKVNADKTQTCVYTDGRKGRGIVVGRGGGSY